MDKRPMEVKEAENSLGEAERSPLDALPTGRDLDALVAEKVMRRVLTHRPSGYGSMGVDGHGVTHNETACAFCGRMLPSASYWNNERCADAAAPYSTDIAAAMEVVEKIQEQGLDCSLAKHGDGPTWFVVFEHSKKIDGKWWIFQDSSDSLPEAICRAALSAVQSQMALETAK